MGALAGVPIALEVLHRIDEGTLPESHEVLVERMVRLGDTSATSRLLHLAGAGAVNRRMVALGAAGVRVDRGTATPAAMTALFVAMIKKHGGLSNVRYQTLMRWMETSTGTTRIKAALPPDVERLAHIEGAMPGATADAVIFDTLNVVVIFTKNAKVPRREVERDIAAVTRVVSDWMDPPMVLSALATPLPPQTSDAVIGVWVKDEGGGWCQREDEAFPMGGLASVPIALEVLHGIDGGTLPASHEELLERMVRLGDTAAADRLLRLIGVAAVNRRMAALGAPEDSPRSRQRYACGDGASVHLHRPARRRALGCQSRQADAVDGELDGSQPDQSRPPVRSQARARRRNDAGSDERRSDRRRRRRHGDVHEGREGIPAGCGARHRGRDESRVVCDELREASAYAHGAVIAADGCWLAR